MGRFVLTALSTLFAALLLLTMPAAAGLRCDVSLVTRGQTLFEVLERCGSPEFEMRFADYRYPGFVVHVEEWTYDLGRNKFRRLLTFENGRLVRIETRGKPRRTVEAVPAQAWLR
jgi:hypothetical protein